MRENHTKAVKHRILEMSREHRGRKEGVVWKDFRSGITLGEALNAGTHRGELTVIFLRILEAAHIQDGPPPLRAAGRCEVAQK
jgi:hypothetical protein